MSQLTNYLEALSYKIQSANYHRIMAEKAIAEEKTNSKHLLAAGAEFIAMMSALHSCLDVLSQWINVKYHLNLKEHSVSFSKIISIVKDDDIKQDLFELKKTAIYLDDFCNYNKHRNIVKVQKVYYFVSPYQPTEIYDIDAFERNGREYPPQTLDYQLHFQYYLILSQLNYITRVNLETFNPDS